MTKLEQKAEEYGFNHRRLVDGHYDTFDDVKLAYFAGLTERCMCCDKVGKWRNLNRIHEKLAQSYKEENEQLKSRLNNAIEYIKNKEEENRKLIHSNNLAERLVGMIPKFEYMSKEHKKLVVLEAEQYIKGGR